MVERRGHVLLIGVNRPHKRNAWDLATIDAVGAAYQRAGPRPRAARRGRPRRSVTHFSAGLDLARGRSRGGGQGPGGAVRRVRLRPLRGLGTAGAQARRHGRAGHRLHAEHRAGAGLRHRRGRLDVRFRQLEVGRGIMPFGGATFRAQSSLGWGNAMRFLLTGEEFGADEALRIGLVQAVVAPRGAAHRGAPDRRPDRRAGTAGRPGDAGQRPGRPRRRARRRPSSTCAGCCPAVLASQDAAEGLRSFVESAVPRSSRALTAGTAAVNGSPGRRRMVGDRDHPRLIVAEAPGVRITACARWRAPDELDDPRRRPALDDPAVAPRAGARRCAAVSRSSSRSSARSATCPSTGSPGRPSGSSPARPLGAGTGHAGLRADRQRVHARGLAAPLPRPVSASPRRRPTS